MSLCTRRQIKNTLNGLMKQLSRACYLGLLTLAMVGCSYVPNIEGRLQSLHLENDNYVARAGETLESIAFRYNLPVAQLASMNPGLRSRIPAGTHVVVRPGSRYSTAYQDRDNWSSASAASDATRSDIVIVNPVNKPEAVASANAVAQGLARSTASSRVQEVEPPMTATVRNEPVQIATYPREEIIEDDFEEVELVASRDRVDKQLRKYIGQWAWPTDGQLARSYAPEKPGGHGVDIAGLPGQHVVAAMDGTVAYSGKDPSGFGKLIIVKHDDSLMTTYSHTRDLFVAEDDVVRAGDPIASLGSNANQESVLRFEVRRDGNPLNPMDFFPAN